MTASTHSVTLTIIMDNNITRYNCNIKIEPNHNDNFNCRICDNTITAIYDITNHNKENDKIKIDYLFLCDNCLKLLSEDIQQHLKNNIKKKMPVHRMIINEKGESDIF